MSDGATDMLTLARASAFAQRPLTKDDLLQVLANHEQYGLAPQTWLARRCEAGSGGRQPRGNTRWEGRCDCGGSERADVRARPVRWQDGEPVPSAPKAPNWRLPARPHRRADTRRLTYRSVREHTTRTRSRRPTQIAHAHTRTHTAPNTASRFDPSIWCASIWCGPRRYRVAGGCSLERRSPSLDGSSSRSSLPVRQTLWCGNRSL